MLSARDPIEDRMTERVKPNAGLSEAADQVPCVRRDLDVVTEEEKSRTTQLSILGGYFALIDTALRAQQLQQIGPCARNILRRD